MISTAILAAPYAVLQRDSFDDPASSELVSDGSQDGEPIDKATALDEATSVLRFLALEWVLTTFFMDSIAVVSVPSDGPFVGVADDERFLRK